MERDFKGVWIPREIWLAEDIGWTAKLLLVEIDSLARCGECYASNDYFARFFSLSKDRISKLISELDRKGYVSVELRYKEGSKQIEKRVITPIPYRQKHLYPVGENAESPIGENAEDNNTFSNNTLNNTDIYSAPALDIAEDNPEFIRYMKICGGDREKALKLYSMCYKT